METYRFKEPYSTRVAVGGVVGVREYSWNKGDLFYGEIAPTKDIPNARQQQMVRSVVNPNPLQGGEMFAYVPMSVLTTGSIDTKENVQQKQNDTVSNTTTNNKKKISTGAIVGIVFGVLVLGTVAVLVIKK